MLYCTAIVLPGTCRLSLLQRHHTAVSAIGYDDKSGLLVIAGDSGNFSSSGGGSGSGHAAGSSGSSSPSAAPAAAFAQEGVTVSVWHLQERELTLKFALGEPQVCGPATQAAAQSSHVEGIHVALCS